MLLPGTSSVSGSLRMPRFHFRGDRSLFSGVDEVVAAWVSTSTLEREVLHGVRLTMSGFQDNPS